MTQDTNKTGYTPVASVKGIHANVLCGIPSLLVCQASVWKQEKNGRHPAAASGGHFLEAYFYFFFLLLQLKTHKIIQIRAVIAAQCGS